MNINSIKKDIQLLLDLGYNIKPIDVENTNIMYLILLFNKHKTLFRLLPLDIIKYNLFPYLVNQFDINRNLGKFKVIIEKKKIKWIIYFSTDIKTNIPITKILTNNGKYVNLRLIKKRIEGQYYTLYIKWLNRFTLPFILLQLRLLMNKWLLANIVY